MASSSATKSTNRERGNGDVFANPEFVVHFHAAAVAPQFHQHLGFGTGFGGDGGAAVGEYLPDDVGLCGRTETVCLDEQQGFSALLEVTAVEFVELDQGAVVQEFHDGGLNAGLAHGKHTGGGAAEVLVERGDGVDFAGQVFQPDGHTHHDSECPFRAHQQRGEIVPGHAFEGLVAGVHEGAVGHDNVQGQDGIAGHAVFRAAQPSGVGGHVAADGGHLVAGRVGRVHEAVFGGCSVKVGVDDAGFDDGGLVVGVEVQDAVHPFKAQHDAALRSVGSAGNAGARTPGNDRHLMRCARADDVLHIVHGFGPDDGQWQVPLQHWPLIDGVDGEGFFVAGHLPGLQPRRQLLQERPLPVCWPGFFHRPRGTVLDAFR